MILFFDLALELVDLGLAARLLTQQVLQAHAAFRDGPDPLF